MSKKDDKKNEDATRAARLAYRREWYKQNKEKQRTYNARYWTKKAQEMQQAVTVNAN